MKTKASIFILTLCLGLGLSCNDDSNDLDPNVFCDESLCATNAALKEQCIDVFNACMATEPDANNDECAAAALLICNL